MPRKRNSQDGAGGEQPLAKAFSHPLRVQILNRLKENVASPSELAQQLDESLNLVAYHVRVLEKYDCVELVKTMPRRGATEHFYRASWEQLLGDAAWAHLSQPLDRSVSHKDLALDERGWDEVATLVAETLERLGKIETEAEKRLTASGASAIEARVEIVQAR